MIPYCQLFLLADEGEDKCERAMVKQQNIDVCRNCMRGTERALEGTLI